MRNLIFDGGLIELAYLAGQDATVIELLNAPTERVRRRGLVSVAGLANDTSSALATKFLATIAGTIAQLEQGGQLEQAQAVLFEAFRQRFINAVDGLDFTNDELRDNITAICTAAGWPPEEIAAVLATGYVMQSKAETQFGRPAERADVDRVRRDDYETPLRQRATNAAALFASRLEQAAEQWDAAEQAAQWSAAWSDA